jgi:hypothetical protein
MISNNLRDFPITRNHPQKTADDQYIRILKNTRKLIKLKTRRQDTVIEPWDM